jgi:hypothetical protein
LAFGSPVISFRIHFPDVLNTRADPYSRISAVQSLCFLLGAVNLRHVILVRDQAPNRLGDTSDEAQFLTGPSPCIVHDVVVPVPLRPENARGSRTAYCIILLPLQSLGQRDARVTDADQILVESSTGIRPFGSENCSGFEIRELTIIKS